MASVGGGAVGGELAIEIDILRTRDVPLPIGGAAVGAVESPAHVEHADGAAVGEAPGVECRAESARSGEDPAGVGRAATWVRERRDVTHRCGLVAAPSSQSVSLSSP